MNNIKILAKTSAITSILSVLLACSAQPPVPEDRFYQHYRLSVSSLMGYIVIALCYLVRLVKTYV